MAESVAQDEGPGVPVEDWVPTPVADSADYLDREPPVYQEEETDVEAT